MSLKLKMIVLAVSGVLISYLGLIPSGWLLWQSERDNARALQHSAISNLIYQSVRSLYPQMEGGMQDFTRNRALKKAIEQQTPAAVEESVITTYRRLSAAGIIDHLEIIDNDGERLYSTLGQQGRVDHYLPRAVLAKREILHGLEMNQASQLFAYVGFPIVNRGATTGIALLIRGISPTLEQIAAIDGSSITVVSPQGMPLASSGGLSSQEGLPLPPLGSTKQAYFDDEVSGTISEINWIPLKDTQGSLIAHIVHRHEVTEGFHHQQLLQRLILSIAIILIILLIIGLQWYINRNFHPLRRAVLIFNSMAEGDLSHRIQVTRRDEIGELMGAASRMIDNLNRVIAEVRGGQIT